MPKCIAQESLYGQKMNPSPVALKPGLKREQSSHTLALHVKHIPRIQKTECTYVVCVLKAGLCPKSDRESQKPATYVAVGLLIENNGSELKIGIQTSWIFLAR